MVRTLVAIVAAAASGAFGAWLILANAYPDEGPYVSLSDRHGIHAGDVVIVVIWLVVVSALALWARRGRPRPARGGGRA